MSIIFLWHARYNRLGSTLVYAIYPADRGRRSMMPYASIIPRSFIHTILFIVIACVLCSGNLSAHEPSPNDDAGMNSGGPTSNPFTVYSGGNGPGECSNAGMPNYWVSTTTRELVVQDTDFTYSGLGPPIKMTRTWNMPRNSAITVFGMFGDRWTFSYEMSIDHSGQSENPPFKKVFLKKGSGQRLVYYVDLSGTPPITASPPTGVYDTLVWYGGYWLLTEKDTHWVYRFDKVSGKNYSRLSSISDPNGNTITLTYDTDQTLKSVTDAAGRTTSFTYDANKHCIAMKAPDGREATYAYDPAGHLIETKDFLGSITTFTYDNKHYMTSMNAAGKTTLFSTDAVTGKIQTVTDARGNVTQYQENTSGSGGILVTDPEGHIRYYSSSQQGYTAIEMNMGLKTFTLTSYLNGRPSEFTDAKGNIHKYEYDTRGNLTKITDPLYHVTTFTYDSDDNLIGMTDALGATWTTDYDNRRNPVRLTSPTGRKTTMTYNSKGQLTGKTDAAGKKRSFLTIPLETYER